MDRSKFIFENEISERAYKKAVKNKAKFIRKYGDDTDAVYHLIYSLSQKRRFVKWKTYFLRII